jgi:5-(carboxyamino)imidazole ribonucleotide synthase
MQETLLPGLTIGIYGQNRASQDLVIAAKKMGYHTAVLSVESKAPALEYADLKFIAQSENWQQVQNEFSTLSNMITYGSSWLPSQLIDKLDLEKLPQGKEMLELTDDHAMSRALFESQSMNILPYVMVSTLNEVVEAAKQLGFPVVVKPIFKHQQHERTVVLQGEWDLGNVAGLIDGSTLIVQTWLDNVREFAMTAVRNQKGEFVFYPLRQTEVDENGLRRAWIVENVTPEFSDEVRAITQRLGDAVNYVGAYSVSFLYGNNGFLYVRDLAAGITETARVYDLATNIAVPEQHLRAITGQALINVELIKPTVLMPFVDGQKAALYRHWQIKPEWRISTFWEHQEKQAGYVLASGEKTDDLLNQLKIANVWKFKE